MYYIGVDGGGTKTTFGLFNEDKELIDQIELSTCHFLQVGYKGCASVLEEGITRLVEKFDISKTEVKIGMGIAGYGEDKVIRNRLEASLQTLFDTYHCVISNDMYVAMLGALDEKDGIVVVAGTGSIAMAKVNQKIHRCGGWGYQLGDEGSAYWIGKRLLALFCKQSDGRLPKSLMYTRMLSHFKLDSPYKIIEVTNNFTSYRKEVAKLSLVCKDLSIEGDPYCTQVLQEAAGEVGELVASLVPYFNSQVVVSYYGGVFNNSIFKNAFYHYLNDLVTIMPPKHDAIYGAMLLARSK